MSWQPCPDPVPGDVRAADRIETSPVRTSSSMFYADVMRADNASVPLDPDYEERAIYTVTGDVEISGEVFGPAQLLVFRPGVRITIRARTEARFMMLGGDAMDGPRVIWWNFVSSLWRRLAAAIWAALIHQRPGRPSGRAHVVP